MTVSEVSFAAIDFESAGIRRGGTDVPVQVGAAVLCGGVISDFFSSFLSTDQPITWSAQRVHGIRTDDLRDAPALTDLWPRLRELLGGRWMVAHGAATERRFLRAFPFHGFGPWVDTLRLARAVWPDRASFALGDLVVASGLEGELRRVHPDFRWHDALSDAAASLVLLRHVIAECNLGGEEAEILLRPDDSHYHRMKSRG